MDLKPTRKRGLKSVLTSLKGQLSPNVATFAAAVCTFCSMKKITFSAMLFTRILLGLELDHLLAHLAVLEQQHLPDCQERSLGRKSWRKLVLVATKRRREAIKRNFSQPASLTSYSGENFGAEILLTAAGQNWAK